MLVELSVRNLGVIPEARVAVGAGLVAVTGETGAGKTMIVEALRLLGGARPDPTRVRPGAEEIVVEGLFAVGDTEWVLGRTVPAAGRSRAAVNGALATAGGLAELGESLMEVHGQHAQQALLRPGAQRSALDRHGGVDREELLGARRTVRELAERLDGLGGDERARAREVDLLRHQIEEIERVAPVEGEDDRLEAEEGLLADAVGHRESAAAALDALLDEGGAGDRLALAADRLEHRAPFAAVSKRLAGLAAELGDCAADLRSLAEGIEPDEERLAAVRERRHALVELRRKYGDTVEEVVAHRDEAARRLDELESLEATRAAVREQLGAAHDELGRVCAVVGDQRRTAAPSLAAAVGERLDALALGGARVEVAVRDTDELPGAGEAVELRLAVNRGAEPAPLSKVASGGELSRVMLALRLVLSDGPPTMVFDEVDAGIGGETAIAVGRALRELGRDRQVLVVTHLAQVAAFADTQLLVEKSAEDGTTRTTVRRLDDDGRIVELARMLSGQPDSEVAREHAAELLASADPGRVLSAGPVPRR